MAGVGHPLPLPALVPLVSFANTISNLTPASAGEVLRAVILRDRYGVPVVRSTAVILRGACPGPSASWPSRPGSRRSSRSRDRRRPSRSPLWSSRSAAASCPRSRTAPASDRAGSWSVGRAHGSRPRRWQHRGGDPGRGRTDPRAAPIEGAPRGPRRGGSRSFAGDAHRRPLARDGVRAATLACSRATAVQLWSLLQMLWRICPAEAAWAALGLATLAGVVSALPFGLGAAERCCRSGSWRSASPRLPPDSRSCCSARPRPCHSVWPERCRGGNRPYDASAGAPRRAGSPARSSSRRRP
jgi:hypothetical protein